MRTRGDFVDRRIPLYLQIKNVLLDRVDNGELLPGERIDSERELAFKYGVNRQTIRSAINVLIEDGILVKIPKKGTYVAKHKQRPASWGNFENIHEKRGFTEFLKAQGFNIGSKVLIAEKIESTKSISLHLNINVGDTVFCLERIRYSDGEPFSLEIAYIPYKYVEGIEDYDFSKVSLYDFMDTKGHRPIRFKRSLILMNPSERVDKLLESKGQPVYSFQYIGYDNDGNISEYTQSYMRSDKGTYRFRI